MKLHAMKFIALVAIVLLHGCGYKPSSKYAKNVVGEKISTSVLISAQDPENTVIVKDAVDSAIIQVFRSSLVPRSDSSTHLNLKISNPSYSPIQYNEEGFVVAYRMHLTLHIEKIYNGLHKEYTTVGTYDFAVEPNAVITDQERFNAIKLSAAKAIASFVARISAEGARGTYDNSSNY
jgi:hypothetical protein